MENDEFKKVQDELSSTRQELSNSQFQLNLALEKVELLENNLKGAP